MSAVCCLTCFCFVCLKVGYRRDQYKRSANLLEAVSQLLEYFSQYENLSKIQSLKRRLAVVQSGLQASIEQEGSAEGAAGVLPYR